MVAAAAGSFLERGYEATSIDDLVAATGLHRGSLYKAFGSKRGIFLAALHRLVRDELPAAAAHSDGPVAGSALDLLLVAALELGPRDPEVRDLLRRACALLLEAEATSGDPATLLGRRLLERADVHAPALLERKDKPWRE